MRGQPFAEQRAARQRIDQALQRGGLFVEQGEVTGPLQQHMQQRQQAAQRRIRLRRQRRRLQQRRQHPIEPRARRVGQLAHAGRTREIAQAAMQVVAGLKARIRQRSRIAIVGQAAPVQGQVAVAGGAPARREQGGEFRSDPRAHDLQLVVQRGHVRMAQPQRDALALRGIRRQHMGLRIAQHLDAVLQHAQEPVGIGQRVARCGIDMPGLHQRPQGRQQPAFAQRRLAPAADQLEGLRQEFDLADAARAALDVVGQFLARHFRGDRRLHRAQPVERAVVEVAPVYERPQCGEETFAGGEVAGHRPRLLPGVALPVAAFALEVLLHRRERQRHPPGIAERAQAQVDSVAEAVRGHLVQQLRQLLAEPREVVGGGQRAHAVGFAFVLVGVDKVDIGGKIQLAAAELAEAEHHQSLCVAFRIADDAEALRELGFQCCERQLQAAFGECGAAGQDRIDLIVGNDIAPDQARRFRLPVAPQQARPIGAVAGIEHRRRRRSRAIVSMQAFEQVGLRRQRGEGEIAREGEPAQLRHEGRVAAPAGIGRQQRELAFDQRGEIMHRTILACGRAHAGWNPRHDARQTARNKKARFDRSLCGPAPSPTSGCRGIVKESLGALHAALQKRTDQCRNQAALAWIPRCASTACAASSPDSQPPSMKPCASIEQCSPAKCRPPTASPITPPRDDQSPGWKQA